MKHNNCVYGFHRIVKFIIMQKPCLGKIWLYAKMPSANQIAWFFKFESSQNLFEIWSQSLAFNKIFQEATVW